MIREYSLSKIGGMDGLKKELDRLEVLEGINSCAVHVDSCLVITGYKQQNKIENLRFQCLDNKSSQLVIEKINRDNDILIRCAEYPDAKLFIMRLNLSEFKKEVASL